MFEYTIEELNQAKEKFFLDSKSVVLEKFPKKLKQKYLCLLWIKDVFEEEVIYSEKEVNTLLEAVYPDYVMIRRFLIDYGFLNRKSDGSSYWKTTMQN